MTSHLSQQLTVLCLEYTATENRKASCIIYDITALAVLIWLNHYLLTSITDFYFYPLSEITIIILNKSVANFNCEYTQGSETSDFVLYFCYQKLLTTLRTQGLFIKLDVYNYFIFRVQALLFLRCHRECVNLFIHSCISI